MTVECRREGVEQRGQTVAGRAWQEVLSADVARSAPRPKRNERVVRFRRHSEPLAPDDSNGSRAELGQFAALITRPTALRTGTSISCGAPSIHSHLWGA